MDVIWTKDTRFYRDDFKTEKELEDTILKIQGELFGSNRVYLSIKRKIGKEGKTRNIPDGYLIDLAGKVPRLFVVENELAAHDPLRHIAVQILQFSLSFEESPLEVKAILLAALHGLNESKKLCEKYATISGYRNLDYLLEYLVSRSPFAALVVIDRVHEELQGVLAEKFKFPVEVLEVARFKNEKGEASYLFRPFLSEVVADTKPTKLSRSAAARGLDLSEIDTIVVPARRDGFEKTFLGQNRWHAIRINATMRPQIRHIAGYQVAPQSAITHVAEVKSIEPWPGTDKFVVNFAAPARPIKHIRRTKGGKEQPLFSPRYTSMKRIEAAKTLGDVWPSRS